MEVTIRTSLTWGEKENLKQELFRGARIGAGGLEGYDVAAVMEERLKTVETCVTGIKTKDGTDVKWSREWMLGLDSSDGDALVDAINAALGKKD